LVVIHLTPLGSKSGLKRFFKRPKHISVIRKNEESLHPRQPLARTLGSCACRGELHRWTFHWSQVPLRLYNGFQGPSRPFKGIIRPFPPECQAVQTKDRYSRNCPSSLKDRHSPKSRSNNRSRELSGYTARSTHACYLSQSQWLNPRYRMVNVAKAIQRLSHPTRVTS
jgi:hypothetical protein